jgi:hypothetical protein
MPILWIQGGVGGASAGWRYKGPFGGQLEDRTDNVPAVALAAGLEVIKGKSFSLDVQLRVGTGFYEEETGTEGQTGRSSSLGVGFTWY